LLGISPTLVKLAFKTKERLVKRFQLPCSPVLEFGLPLLTGAPESQLKKTDHGLNFFSGNADTTNDLSFEPAMGSSISKGKK
jgi:hypothetical protein